MSDIGEQYLAVVKTRSDLRDSGALTKRQADALTWALMQVGRARDLEVQLRYTRAMGRRRRFL